MCCGKMKIRTRKGDDPKPFCSGCFNYFLMMTPKEIRKILKENKSFVTIK